MPFYNLGGLAAETAARLAAEAQFATITDGSGNYGASITVAPSAPGSPGPFDVWIGGNAYTAQAYAALTTYDPLDLIVYNGRLFQNSSTTQITTSSDTPLSASFAATLALGVLTPVPGNGLWTTQDQGLIAQPYDGSLSFAPQTFSGAGIIQGIRVHVDTATTITNVLMEIATAPSSALTQGQCYAGLFGPTFNLLSLTPDASGTTYTVSTTASSGTVTGTGFVLGAMKGGQYTIAGATGAPTFTVTAVGSGTSLTVNPVVPNHLTSVVMTPIASTVWNSTGWKVMPLVTPQAGVPGDYYIVGWANGSSMPGPLRGNASAQVNGPLSGTSSRYFTADTGVTTAASAPTTLGTSSPMVALNSAYWFGIN